MKRLLIKAIDMKLRQFCRLVISMDESFSEAINFEF